MGVAESEKNIHNMSEAEFEKYIHDMAAETSRILAERGEGSTLGIPDTSSGKAIKRGYREGLENRVDNIHRTWLRKIISNS